MTKRPSTTKKPIKKKHFDRPRIARLANALAKGGDVADVLRTQQLRPSQAVRALRSRAGRIVMREVRKLVALQRYLRLEITEEQMEEACRLADAACAPTPRAAAHREIIPAPVPLDDATLESAIKQMAEEDDTPSDCHN